MGGQFLLRIEDTDRERNSPAAVAAILDGMKWLGLDHDGDTVSQFDRADRHREVANELLATGRAYKCYLSTEELDAMRKEAQEAKQPLRIRSPWRERDPSEAPEGVPPVIRLMAPQEGETIVRDHVQGDVVIQNKELDDLIILRSDGNPTYNLAVVVDDHDMGVTHVIRGVDHLTNAARQTQIYEAMGWPVPEFAHVPLIHGPDGAKLSKRHGALGVEAYRAMGYLPAALRNYLVRLGWSHGDDEVFSTEQMIEWFEIDGIGRSPARFDFAKLEDLNAQYMRSSSDAELLAQLKAVLPELEGGAALAEGLDRVGWEKLEGLLPGLKERARTLNDLVAGSSFLIASRPIEINEKARKLLDQDSLNDLKKLMNDLSGIADWSAGDIEQAVRTFAEDAGLKLGKIAQPLRAAVTGSNVSPPIFDVMAALGRDECLARICDQTGG
jgi:glutamyl-tRNA synthetase